MAQSIETLSVKLTSDTSEFSGALDKAKESTSAFGSLATGALQGVGMAAFNMAASAASSFIGFASDGIDMASDLGETTSKVETVFGQQSDAIKAWAADAATSMGQTSAGAMGAAATFGNLFVSMGLTEDSSADMSMNLVGLATDLASFNNMSTDEALEKLKAGMLGSAEPMQSLGVNMTAAMTTAKALELGLADSAAALTPAMLAQARYALILEQTTTAQGDFAKTSDGLANQQRIADAQWKELQTTIGGLLLPVVLSLTRWANDFLSNVMPYVTAAVAAAGPIFESLGGFVTMLIDTFILGKDATEDWGGGFDLFTDLVGEDAADAILTFLDGAKALRDFIVGAAGPMITDAIEWFKSLGSTMQGQADGPMSYMSKWFDENMPRIQQIVDTVLTAISGFWETHGAAIMHVAENLLSVVTLLFDTAFKTIMDAVTFFLQLLTGDFEGAGETLAGIVERLWSTIKTVFQTQLDSIWTLVKDIDWMDLGMSIVEGIANGIGNAATVLMTAVDRLSENAWDRMTGWWQTGSPSKVAAGLGADIGEGMGIGIPDGIDAAMPQVNAGLSALYDALADGAVPAANAGLSAIYDALAGNAGLSAIYDALADTGDQLAVPAVNAGLSAIYDALADVGASDQLVTAAIPKTVMAAPNGNMLDSSKFNQPTPAITPRPSTAAGLLDKMGQVVVNLTQNFYGPTTADAVGAAATTGIKAGLRAIGSR